MATLKYKKDSNWVNLTLSNSTILSQVYPVGSLYISNTSTSPASRWGGTWTPVTGYFPYFNASTTSGGSNTHTHALNNGYAQVRYDFTNSPNLQFGMSSHTWSTSNGMMIEFAPTSVNRKKEGELTASSNKAVALAGNSNSASSMPAYRSFYAWYRTA